MLSWLGSLGGSALSRTGAEEERKVPPPATPLTFPSVHASDPTVWSSQNPPPDLSALFAAIVRPSDIRQQHIDALNIEHQVPCSFAELLPEAPDGRSYLPQETGANSPAPASTDSSEGEAPSFKQARAYRDRLEELRTDDDLAFQILNRRLPPGVKAPRLVYMRKFFENLENMSQYWDCSLDIFTSHTIYDSESEDDADSKRQRLDSVLDDHLSLSDDPESAADDLGDPQDPLPEPRGKSHIEIRYKGRRTSTGRRMPDQFRVDVVRSFVEGTLWPFQAATTAPRVPPHVSFGNLRIPVRQTAVVYLMPRERLKARQGWLNGPCVGVQARPETDFEDDQGVKIEAKARLDLLREIGGLVQLAQERYREGKAEVRPGEGKWWTAVPRWGGGSGGEPQSMAGGSSVLEAMGDMLTASSDKSKAAARDTGRSRKAQSPAQQWKELKCGSSSWDAKAKYKAIGKDPMSDYDEVFLVSSLNHHISVLKLTVHAAYLDVLLSGTVPDPPPDDEAWCRPKLQRTRWFNMFHVEDRVELFQGLWGVASFIFREQTEQSGEDAGMGNG